MSCGATMVPSAARAERSKSDDAEHLGAHAERGHAEGREVRGREGFLHVAIEELHLSVGSGARAVWRAWR